MKKEKIKIIIDSDVGNEIDDQFAICYAFSRQEKFDILAITLEPFRVEWQNTLSMRDSLIEGRNETYRILNLFGVKHTLEHPFVYLGCEGFISEGYDGTNPAVQKIIELAKKHKDITICCLGTLTNVARAIQIDPTISKNIKIVWLGTGNILLDKFVDSNFRKDKEAFNIVLASNADFTIYPSYMARNFVSSIYEFSKNTTANAVVTYLKSIVNRFEHISSNLGMFYAFDIGVIAYLLMNEKFCVKDIDAKMLLKEGKADIPKSRKVHEIVETPKYFDVWKDFLNAVNSNKRTYLKSQIFFTSDTHFNQERKVKFKQTPFGSVEEMNRELVRRWNAVVAPGDIVYHLGDFGDYDFIKKLNGKVILICGNYEKRDFKDFEQFKQKLKKLGFYDVYENGIYLDEKVFGQKVFLTHKPTDRAKDCINLFGHVHALKCVTRYGFNVGSNYHYSAPIGVEAAKRYLDFIEHHSDQDVFE